MVNGGGGIALHSVPDGRRASQLYVLFFPITSYQLGLHFEHLKDRERIYLTIFDFPCWLMW